MSVTAIQAFFCFLNIRYGAEPSGYFTPFTKNSLFPVLCNSIDTFLNSSFSDELKLVQRNDVSLLRFLLPSYIRYENGTSEPKLETLVKIADIFDVSVNYLLGRTND